VDVIPWPSICQQAVPFVRQLGSSGYTTVSLATSFLRSTPPPGCPRPRKYSFSIRYSPGSTGGTVTTTGPWNADNRTARTILFAALTEKLGLPAGLPVTRVPGSLSALVVLGNMFVEILRPAPGRHVGVPLDQGAFGVVLEPDSTEDAVAELDRRSIPHAPPFPDPRPLPPGGLFNFDPKAVPPYRAIMIGGVLGDRFVARNAAMTPKPVALGMTRILVRFWGTGLADRMFQTMSRTRAVYVNEWHPQIRAVLDPDRLRGLLDDVGGGRIGLTGVREIVMGAADIEKEIERWQALLAPLQLWALATGNFPAGPRYDSRPAPDSLGGSYAR
jgi:hypothetical protein